MATPNLSEIVSTTLRNRSGKLADNVTNNNALLFRLNSKGNVKPVDGGRTIVKELDWQVNGTYKRYSGYETLDISPQEVISAAEFDWKQGAVSVSISGLEELQNSGSERVIDLLEGRIKNAERTMANSVSTDLYSDGTASGGKQIGGLQHIVADAPSTGTVGGINRANFTFWRNFAYDATTDGGAAATAALMQGYMNHVWLNVVRGTDRPDLIIADNAYFKLYLESLQTIQRVASDDMASAGFTSLKYMDADVVFDGGYGGDAPTDHMYFLNTDFICWQPHKDRNMTPLNPDRFSVNQDAMVKLIAFAGNLTASNCFSQGLLLD